MILNLPMRPVFRRSRLSKFSDSIGPPGLMHAQLQLLIKCVACPHQSTRACRIVRIKYANCNQKDSFDITYRFYIMLKNRRPISAPPLTVGSTSSLQTSSPPWRKSSKRTRRIITSKGDNPVCRSFVKGD